MLGNIKQPPLTPKLSTSCAGVDLTLPTMTSHGAYRDTTTELNGRLKLCAYSSLPSSRNESDSEKLKEILINILILNFIF